MTTLLTGGTGLLGANLARLLCSQGERPRILLREHSDRRGLHGLSYDEVIGDILSPLSMAQGFKGVKQLYHVAGAIRFDPFSRGRLQEVNIQGTQNVLATARQAGVRRVLVVSSAATVGHGTLDAPATEESSYNFEGDNPYHESKRAAEALALAASDEQMEVVIANPTVVVGPYDVLPSTMGELLLFVVKGLAVAYPSGGFNVVNAMDVAEGLQKVMQKGKPKERYLLGGENLTFRQFLTLCAEEAGVAPPRLPMPKQISKAAGHVGDRLGFLSPELFKFLNTPFLQALDVPAYQSSGKAMRELGYRVHPIRLGIREALRWFQEQGLVSRDHALQPQGVLA